MALKLDVRLRCGSCGLGDRRALGDADLGLDDIDAGDLLGHGMLDLDPRVDLDEVEIAAVHVLQEFHRAGALVFGVAADFQTQFAKLGALDVVQIRRRGALDDLLVAALDRAVALIEMVEVAVMVAQHLHLDMAGALDHLFQIALAVAKGGLGLAASLANLVCKLLGAKDRAHPAPAAAPGRFQHDRVADFIGHCADGIHVAGCVRIRQHWAGRDHRNPRGDGGPARAGLVAQHPHGCRRGADEGNAGRLAGIHEGGVLRQQAIARVDRVSTAVLGHPDDRGDVEICRHRPLARAHLIGLIGLEAV